MRIEFKKYYYAIVYSYEVNDITTTVTANYIFKGGYYIAKNKIKDELEFKQIGYYKLQGEALGKFKINNTSEGDSIYTKNQLYYNFKGELAKLENNKYNYQSLGLNNKKHILLNTLIIEPYSTITIPGAKGVIKLGNEFAYEYNFNVDSNKAWIFEY